MAGFVEEHDQVDVGGIVELARAHLAHGERKEPGAVGGILGGAAGQLAALDLGGDEADEGRVDRGVGKAGEGVGDLAELPDAAEIGERDEERAAALGPAERIGERRRVFLGADLGEERLERVLRGGGDRHAEPFGLALGKEAEIARAGAGGGDQVAGRRGEVGEPGGEGGGMGGVVRAGAAGDAVGKAVGHGGGAQRPS